MISYIREHVFLSLDQILVFSFHTVCKKKKKKLDILWLFKGKDLFSFLYLQKRSKIVMHKFHLEEMKIQLQTFLKIHIKTERGNSFSNL